MKYCACFVSISIILHLQRYLQVVYAAPVYLSIREAAEDTVLTIPNPVGQEGSTTIPVCKGTHVRTSSLLCASFKFLFHILGNCGLDWRS